MTIRPVTFSKPEQQPDKAAASWPLYLFLGYAVVISGWYYFAFAMRLPFVARFFN